ncbi:DNA translocase FtsK 4TM domain-containing protein [Pseudochelatococcus sp. G4_1912]|uniref:DNA translocase FtsK 4TM domain-containing protein n=1 Tax=Pseudochelatococcus sp. G4_1912 TaxID=3114288 RepID=UPI0039C745AC
MLNRAVELAGLALLAVVGAAVVALMTWSVTDPSFTHATDQHVANMLGLPGAIFADLAMQIFGLGSIALLVPCAIWAFRLIARKPLPRMGLRLGLWILGTAAAAAVASAMPETARWPLPSGLGGVVGDALLFGGTGLFGEGSVSGFIIGIGYAAVGILALSAASGFGLAAQPQASLEDEYYDLPVDEDDSRDEPGWGIVSLGAAVHGLMTVKAAASRRFRKPDIAYGNVGRGGHEPVFGDEYADEYAVGAAPSGPAPSGYYPNGVAVPARAQADIYADNAVPPEVAAFAPSRERVSRVQLPRGPIPAAVPLAQECDDAPYEGNAPDDAVPAWRKPFQLPPNVRFTRSTDRELAARHRGNTDEAALDFVPADDLSFDAYGAEEAAATVEDDAWLNEMPLSAAHDFATLDSGDAPYFGEDSEIGEAIEDMELSQPLHAPPAFNPRTMRAPTLSPSNDDMPRSRVSPRVAPPAPVARAPAPPQPARPVTQAVNTRRVPATNASSSGYEMPPLSILALPSGPKDTISEDALEQNAALLESTLEDFGVRGDIIQVRPGPVVTLYELEPAPGTKSSRVISLADDIARSMSAISARVAVVPGRNAIGIELPNAKRETVYLRESLASEEFQRSKFKLALCLGKTIGGEPVIADLARMPHLLVAGTTGSGKSVAINTMIMSLLYRLKPEECRLIMVDPKMLELSIYDGIPHLLTPVVTDPKKAVVALKWAVREMEERYKKMSKLSVRNIDGFNTRVRDAKLRGEIITRTVQTGFDRDTGEAIYEDEVMDLEPLPYIVVLVDEMADLMMVAGKEIEGTIQRLAQMARAAGIHVILATQRPSVDVITGTIKANFPTRISFQVTSKIDSRTILGEQGAEQLLGQGDMLYMAGGGRVMRVHGPFVSDDEVEKIVAHLKTQGRPQYLEAVTADEEAAPEGDGGAVFDNTSNGSGGSNDLYDQAIAIVLRDRKASTSYIQRRLQIGYNRAASIMERMELEGIVGAANHAGKREILLGGEDQAHHG